MLLDDGKTIRNVFTADIASGASVSQNIDLGSSVLTGFTTPAAWTAAAINLEVSLDGTNWLSSIYDSNGSLTGTYLTPVVSAGYAIDTLALIPYRYIRFRSGTNASPVNQVAARSLSIITRPFN